MIVLALDTTSEKGGVGIYAGERCLALEANTRPANLYSTTLFELVERALGEARLSLREIELLAVANGPGSFTGIRVGVAAAQGWATAFGRPLGGVSVLQALVEEARPEADWALPILDAHRGEFFLGLFRRSSTPSSIPIAPGAHRDALEQVGEGWVLKPEALAALLREKVPEGASAVCLVREHDATVPGLRERLPVPYAWQAVPGLLVGAIARLAQHAHDLGKIQSPGELDACYIRRPDAELNWRD